VVNVDPPFSSACSANGISCDLGNIVYVMAVVRAGFVSVTLLLLCREVRLDGAHMVGTLPSTMSALRRLTSLVIANCPGLTGSIPDTIPKLRLLRFVLHCPCCE
jgi:hypothetical protein